MTTETITFGPLGSFNGEEPAPGEFEVYLNGKDVGNALQVNGVSGPDGYYLTVYRTDEAGEVTDRLEEELPFDVEAAKQRARDLVKELHFEEALS